MIRDYEAARELERITPLSAFNVKSCYRRKLNQHATIYGFSDGSRMLIYANGRAQCWHPHWQGRAADVHLRPDCRRVFGR